MGNEAIGGWSTELFERFLSLFCRKGSAPITRIGAWLQMRELKELIEHTSWKFPYAAFCRDENFKKLIPRGFWKDGVFENQRENFGKFYDMVSPISLDTFLAIYPTLVRQLNELTDLRAGLKKDEAAYIDDTQWGFCIFGAIYSYEQYREGHCDTIDMANVFQDCLKKRNISIPDDIAFSILIYTTMYPFTSRKRREKLNAMEAYKKLEEGHCTPMKMLEIYKDVHKIIRKDTEYSSKSKYIKAAKGLKNFRIDIGDNEAIEEACSYLEALKRPSDFVGVVMERMNGENSCIETGFTQICFLDILRPGDKILIINPSAYFVQSWPESLWSSTTFCVMNELERLLLQEEFSQAAFCLADTVEMTSFTKTLYFPRPTEDDTQKTLIRQICERSFDQKTKKTGLMMLIASDDERIELIKSHYPGVLINKLPRMTVGVEPKRRVLVTAMAGENSQKVEKQNQYKLFSKTMGVIGYKDTIPKSAEPLYLLFALNNQETTSSGKERPAKCVEFSQDIRIWYKTSPCDNGKVRVDADLYYPPTEMQKRRNKNQRGAKISGTNKTKICPDEDAGTGWLINEYPYFAKIQTALAGLFRSKKQEVCLKTAWYLSLDLDRYSRKLTQEKGEAELMPYFGDIQANEKDPAKFREAMDMFRKEVGLTQEREKSYWNVLDNLFASLRKNGFCNENPVSVINAEFHPRHTRESQLRDALTKKSFSKKELQALYQNISTQIQPSDNIYLGMALRLLTGLKVEVLCALKWGDLRKLPSKEGGYQLWIMRKATPNGKECVELDTNEEYRRYPLMDLVARFLLDRREYILNVLTVKESALKKKYILSSDAELVAEVCPIPQPNQWKRLGKKMIEQLNIKNVVLDLPSEDGGKETDLTSYHGDIFNTNFRYDLRYLCHIPQSEERYLMGLQQTDTYSKHYLDFTNDALQQRIITKLNRMTMVLSAPETAPASSVEYHPYNGLAEIPGKTGYYTQIDLDICASMDTDLTVAAESRFGEHIVFHISEVQDAKEKEQ